jgi:glycosyltransferase involved in cell wall biosynthesis
MVGVLSESWTAALAVFPRSEHYYEKELTKFFEYMAAGLPILSSDFPTWRALIEPDECGLVVDPADSDAIVAAVMRLHQDRQLAVDMGARGRKVSQERYSWQVQAGNLLALYDRIAPRAGEAV